MSLENEIIQFFKAVALNKDRESSRLLVLGREEESIVELAD